jgi:formamidopyrimidine-DNA glycosylase
MDPILNMEARWDDFTRIVSAKKVPIKSLLLDQVFTAGIGNWMADDVLMMARIDPHTVSSALNSEQQKALFRATIDLSKEAVKLRCAGEEYPKEWLFHVRWDRKSTKTLTGVPLKTVKIAGRTTVYCPSRLGKASLSRRPGKH